MTDDVVLTDLAGVDIDGRYVLHRMLGEGGFGVVWLADQLFLGERARRVAVKICRQRAATTVATRELFGDAFLLAAAMDAMVDGPARACLVPVHDVGIARALGDRGYLVMEFVEGTTLAEQFRLSGGVAANQLLAWMRQVCVGLAGLHALDPPLIHRDLKPENVLLGLDRGVRLVDFGLAARVLGGSGVRGAAGTPPYMAPETLLGRSVAASDVYSVGAMLYEGLTARLPFAHLRPPADLPPAAVYNWLHEHRRTAVLPPPSTANPTVSAALDQVVDRCLRFDAQQRYGDARLLLAALSGPLDLAADAARARADAGRVADGGDAASARRLLERALAAPATAKAERYRLLRQLGELLERSGEPLVAAGRLTEAWELVKDSAVLRTTAERSELMRAVARCYRAGGNAYFGSVWENRARSVGGVAGGSG